MNDLQNPLFLHPYEGPGSIAIQEKLSGAQNCRSWRRAVEIGLTTKRKLGIIQGIVTKSSDDSEELELMNHLPQITLIVDEIKAFIEVMNRQREEQRLFQFLNGLDEVYRSQRIQMLLITPLPIVEMACSMLQEEGTQRDVLEFNKLDVEPTALYSRNEDQRCS
ncbi:hypothetical protein Cgig2_010116 [Carnegiea gigantea]|uniref:Uncharacterized protein n=1 Tax=Carnegiea gigantea TaxID=171969 RepID=A0A9Q1Q5H1_9CARY|nr:hypothetical protein Cgig2_010116 [Carnegiea gigantea]